MAFLQPRIIFIAIFFFLSLVSSTPVKLPSGSSAAVTNHISVFRGIVSRGGDAKRPKYEDYVPNKTTDRVVTLVYRSDRRAPSAISNEGGFRPQGQYEDSEDAFRINLHTRFRVLDDSGNPLEENSDSEGSQESDYPDSDASDDEEPAKDYVAWPSAYVSTATSHYYAIKVNEAVEHYLYIIHAVPSMFVNDGVEDEVLAVGGIPWSLVRGWLRIGLEGEFPTLAEVEDRMEPNPAYNPQMWEGLAATPDLPSGWDQQHSRQSAINFMSQPGVGTHVGWTGRFPLPFPSPSTAGSSAEPVPGPSNQQSFHDPAVTLSEEDVVTAADYLRTREPCEDSSLDARTRHSTLEADAAFARRLASLDHARAGDATSDLIGQQDPSARAIYDRLRNAEEPSTCHLATECRGYLRRASEKREITGGLAQVCQKIFRPMGLSSTGKTKAPAQCTKIHTIHIDLSLSNAEGAGTYDQIAGTLEGPAGTAKFVFATKPWGNSKFTVSVKAKDSFNTDEINLNSIKRLNITAQGLIGFLPLYNDKFQVQGKMMEK
ncbi:hypothetical protein BB8028_0009g00020 [Beauveria bassiana]|uniref:Heat-labile enterotoxin IIA, A chain n=1 Tax=Beauveria bassiana TaxID=176275 RepID=A0A2S7YP09_BEABA|nr:hypothetical protein BB8028_0009g00020 [Beauveria bassiana]